MTEEELHTGNLLLAAATRKPWRQTASYVRNDKGQFDAIRGHDAATIVWLRNHGEALIAEVRQLRADLLEWQDLDHRRANGEMGV